MSDNHAPFSMSMHCSAHRLSLVGKGMDKVVSMASLIGLISAVYTYFAHSNERFRNLNLSQELAEGGTSGSARPQRAVATRWFSCLGPAERMWARYATWCLFFADAETQPGLHQPAAITIYSQLMDFRRLVMLSLYLPILRVLNTASKALQRTDGYVLDDVKVRCVAR